MRIPQLRLTVVAAQISAAVALLGSGPSAAAAPAFGSGRSASPVPAHDAAAGSITETITRAYATTSHT